MEAECIGTVISAGSFMMQVARIGLSAQHCEVSLTNQAFPNVNLHALGLTLSEVAGRLTSLFAVSFASQRHPLHGSHHVTKRK